jgi:agmatine/peptidylarginine deiminase
VNLYIANGGVVAPAFGDDKRGDEDARAVLQKAFPDREVPVLLPFFSTCRRQTNLFLN